MKSSFLMARAGGNDLLHVIYSTSYLHAFNKQCLVVPNFGNLEKDTLVKETIGNRSSPWVFVFQLPLVVVFNSQIQGN